MWFLKLYIVEFSGQHGRGGIRCLLKLLYPPPHTKLSSRTKIIFNWNNQLHQKVGWKKTLDIVLFLVCFLCERPCCPLLEILSSNPISFYALFLLEFNIVWCGICIRLKPLTRYFQNCSKKWNWKINFTREAAPYALNSIRGQNLELITCRSYRNSVSEYLL